LTKKNNSQLVLASASKSRASILKQAGVDFRSMPSFCDEEKIKKKLKCTDTPTEVIASRLAKSKANTISKRHPDLYVLAADQILECNGINYDKPKNLEQARQHLVDLRGKCHSLYTVTVIYRASECTWQNSTKVKMQMRNYSDAFIDTYLSILGPSVCETVGAYKLEGMGSQLFEFVTGDYFSILGLPLLPLLQYLRQIGILDE